MWDMRRSLNVKLLPDRRCTIQFLYSELEGAQKSWWLVVEGGTVDSCSFDPGYELDLLVKSSLRSMTAIWMGLTTITKETDSGQLEIEGDRRWRAPCSNGWDSAPSLTNRGGCSRAAAIACARRTVARPGGSTASATGGAAEATRLYPHSCRRAGPKAVAGRYSARIRRLEGNRRAIRRPANRTFTPPGSLP